MKLKEVEFNKCAEYKPLSSQANALGMRSFWRATHRGKTIATAYTKAECLKEVRDYISVLNNK